MNKSIYLDNHATTQMAPEVLEAMKPYWRDEFGNPSSPQHTYGQKAFEVVERAREQIAKLIGSNANEIIFTSGATESNNLAIKGVARMYRDRGNHIITCQTEHSSVLDVCNALESEGFEVTYLPVDNKGLISLQDLENALSEKTILVTVMAANNEIGVLQPLQAISKFCKDRGVIFHTDAAQAAGKISLDINDIGIDLLSISSHKMYGPKGVGALYVRGQNPRIRLEPLFHGGGHENGLRPGTLSTPLIVGFGRAAELCMESIDEDTEKIQVLRDRLLGGIQSQLDGVSVNGCLENRLTNNLNLSFAYVEGESLLKSFDDIALSSSSACSSVNLQVSYVLKALGLEESLIHSSIRFGLGRYNTEEEIDYVIKKVVQVVSHLRSLSTLYAISQNKGKEYDLARLPGEAIE